MNLAVIPKLRARASLGRPNRVPRSYYDRDSHAASMSSFLICAFGIGAILFVWGVAKIAMAVIDMVMVAAGIR